MNRSKAEKILYPLAESMFKKLRLIDWQINVNFVDLSCQHVGGEVKNGLGRCSPEPEYKRALIEIDNEAHDTEEEIIRTFRHEAIHIVLADFETYRKAAYQGIHDPTTLNILDIVWSNCVERSVNIIERILDQGFDVSMELRGIE